MDGVADDVRSELAMLYPHTVARVGDACRRRRSRSGAVVGSGDQPSALYSLEATVGFAWSKTRELPKLTSPRATKNGASSFIFMAGWLICRLEVAG